MGGANHTSQLPKLRQEEQEINQRLLGYRRAGYHASADVLADRLDRLRDRIAAAERWANRGKVLVTPSIQSQFETPTPKSASVSVSLAHRIGGLS